MANTSILRSKLKRGWYFTELPGYRDHPVKFRTYSLFFYETLPPIKQEGLEGYGWLLQDRIKKNSLLEGTYPDGTKPDLSNLIEFVKQIDIPLPASFKTFITLEELRGRVRSCTDSYLDLGDYVVRTSGIEPGYLIHFMSDSQWILHWYLYLSQSGDHFVLVSEEGYGFYFNDMDVQPEKGKNEPIQLDQKAIWFCAGSFLEFIYRFWLENELWYRLTLEPKPLNDAQRRYLEFYQKENNVS